MPISSKLIKFLEDNKIKYAPIQHKTVFTAHDKAATIQAKEKIVGKTLVLKLDRELAIVLIPANKNLNKAKLKKAVNDYRRKTGQKAIKKIDFATEALIKKNLKGAKVGAIPPFGAIWKLLTFVDKGLLNNPKIIVNTGDHSCSVKLNPAIFKKLSDIIIGNFSQPRK